MPGLRSADVAELAGVSSAWYEAFECSSRARRFSAAFVQRVADVLRLDDRERAIVLRLALPEVSTATDVFERSLQNGALHALGRMRSLVRRLGAVSSFEEAVLAAAESTQSILTPSCVTLASLERRAQPPSALACGPHAGYVDARWARIALEINAPVRSGAMVLCDNAPHPADVHDDAGHRVRIRTASGGDAIGIHAPDADDYRQGNARLQERSGATAGLFSGGVFRGTLGCSWTEPRLHPPLEVETLALVVATVELTASVSA